MNEIKRNKIWIAPSIQLRIVGFVLLLLVCGLTLAYLSMDRNLEQAAVRSGRFFMPVDWARQALVAPFYLSSVIVLLMATVLTILWSHRMVGPLMVLTAGLRRIRGGDLRGDEHARTTDTFGGVLEDFTKMRSALREKITKHHELLAGIEARLAELAEKNKPDHAMTEELRVIREELRTIIASFNL